MTRCSSCREIQETVRHPRGIHIIEHLMRPWDWHPIFPAPLVEAMLRRARRASDG